MEIEFLKKATTVLGNASRTPQDRVAYYKGKGKRSGFWG